MAQSFKQKGLVSVFNIAKHYGLTQEPDELGGFGSEMPSRGRLI